jgi:tetratricopeptide (TPR) repeat protein
MSDIHITRELLEAVSHGEVPERVLFEIGTQHLANLCPSCRGEIHAWEAMKAGGTNYGYVLQALPAALARHAPELEAGLQRAERDLAAHLSLPQEERRARIERAQSRFRGPFLAEMLIGESRRRIPRNSEEAYHLAELARFIIHRSPGTPESFDLVALASASMANACRAGGDLRRADELFQYVVTHHGVTDVWALAQIDHLEGSLRSDQRLLLQAEALLSRAAMLYRVRGGMIETAQILITMGAMYYQQGSLSHAVETTRAALENLPQDVEPRFYLYGRHNLAVYLTEAGQYREAADLLEVDADLYARFPEPWTQLRLSWLQGKIAAGVMDFPAAERLFTQTRDGFVRQGIGYDAAMVSLDLALLYLKEGRAGEVRRVAEEMVLIFAAQGVHRGGRGRASSVPGGRPTGGGDGGGWFGRWGPTSRRRGWTLRCDFERGSPAANSIPLRTKVDGPPAQGARPVPPLC